MNPFDDLRESLRISLGIIGLAVWSAGLAMVLFLIGAGVYWAFMATLAAIWPERIV